MTISTTIFPFRRGLRVEKQGKSLAVVMGEKVRQGTLRMSAIPLYQIIRFSPGSWLHEFRLRPVERTLIEHLYQPRILPISA